MSAQEAEIVDIKQGQLFEMPRVVEGAITLTQTRNLPLHAEQTAVLMQDGEMGEGHKVAIIGGTGTIAGFTYKEGRMVWIVVCDEIEVEV